MFPSRTLRFVAPLIVSLLAITTLPTLSHAQGRQYYPWASIDIEVADIQRVWRTKLGTAANAAAIRLLASMNLLSPVFVDTDINVSSLVNDLAPLFLDHVARGDLVPLSVGGLLVRKGDFREGDIVDSPSVAAGGIVFPSPASEGQTAWFAVDTDGTLLVATDGAPLSLYIMVLQ